MPKFKYLNDKDSWMLAEHFPDIDFFFSQIWLSSFVNELKNSCGKNYRKVLAVFKPKFYIHFYYGKEDSLKFEQHLLNKMKRDTKFGFLINENIKKWSDRLRKFADELNSLNLRKLENKELWNLLAKQDEIHTDLYEWGWLSNATDMFHATYTTELKNYLDKQIVKGNQNKDLNEVLNILTTPHEKSVAAKEEEGLLKIAELISHSSRKEKLIQSLIEKHHAKYFYLKYLWLGESGVYSKKYYLTLAKKLAKDKITPAVKILEMNKELRKVKRQKEKLFQELKVSKQYKDLFIIYSDFMLTKIYRRYAQIYWAYSMGKLLKEVARRLNLSLDEVRYMIPVELKKALVANVVDRPELKRRLKFCLYYAEKGKDLVTTNSKHPILKQLKPKKQKDVKKLTGQVGCLGKVEGVVRVINSQGDMIKMKEGDILVSIATNPDLVPAMKKAAAIVTEQGGVTSHAAIVSRELNTPCVIGTKVATTVLKDGDKVKVDANKGVVEKI